MSLQFGYRPSFTIVFLRSFIRLFLRIFRLNDASSVLSNEFSQSLDPKLVTTHHGSSLLWSVPNGRTAWRARTFLSEEPLLSKWIFDHTSSNTVFLDVGSNIGTYSLYSLLLGSRFVYCCELDPLNVSILYKNIVLNSFTDKALVLPFAATSSSSVIDIHFRDLSSGDALQSINRPSPFSTRLGSCPHVSKHLSFSLDFIFKQFNLHPPTHIKVDVDGNEVNALRGMKTLLSSCSSLYIEFSNETMQDNIVCKSIIADSGLILSDSMPIFSKNDKSVVGENLLFRRLT